MASLVSEILLSAGQLEKRDLQTELEKVNQKIEDAKFQVSQFLEQHYSDFNPLLVHSTELTTLAAKLKDDIQQLLQKADTELKFQLDCSTSELTTIAGQINAAKLQIGLLVRVARLHTILESLKGIDMEDDVVSFALAVAEAGAIISEAEDGIDTELEIWGCVQLEVQRYKDQLLMHLEDCWNADVQWAKKDTLTLRLNATGKLKNTAMALSSIGHLDRLFGELSLRLLEEVLVPSMRADARLQSDGGLELLDGELQVTELVQLDSVVRNVSTVFEYLEQQLGFQLDDLAILRLVGRQIADDFAKSFVKHCLKATLPTSSSLLSTPEYLGGLERVAKLEQQLMHIQFLTDAVFSEFVANVDVFFADKQCLESMSRARQLMCHDLHDTLVIKDEHDETIAEETGANADTAHLWKVLGESGMEVKWSPFRFPNCQISRSTQELAELLTGLVQEAGLPTASERCSARLLFTVRSICELYVSVVPEYHRDSLEKLPFHAAVAHNNGMFMAHSILTLGTGHLIKFVHQNAVPLMDLVGKFRTLAAQIFLDHMKKQREQFLAVFKEAGYNRLDDESRLPPTAEKAARQCLHQLRSLQKVWQPTLPEEVYLRAVGTLANAVLEELLVRVTNMEDIPAAAALQLADQCQTIADTLPKLFCAEEGETAAISQVVHCIHLWPRFQELRHLLGANLKDIEDRWSSGKGPLAAHFGADEVKQMIRALFMNTDHRAATLSRIK